MFLDASAVVAILVDEPDGDILALKIRDASVRLTSQMARYETVLAVARILRVPMEEADAVLIGMMDRYEIKSVDLTPEIGTAAIAAFARYGKGRHPASLNMGDCFAYACAQIHRVPLLCKGNDFHHTDIKIA